jgi:hypothetical protein
MKQIGFAVVLALGVLVSTVADAQTSVRLRGTITAVEGNTLSVRSREGENLALQMPDNVAVAVAKAVKFEDIKQGDYVGAATMKQPDGSMVAIEVHYLAPSVPEGQTPWDLEPDSTMTNANVAASVGATGAATGKRELMLQLKGGSQKIIVPESAAVVRAVPGTRADLKPGEYVFAIVQKGADGKLTAPRIQVSKDGVKPPQ